MLAPGGFFGRMHGSVHRVKDCVAKGGDAHAVEASSGRSALHKAAFWGHKRVAEFLTRECRVDVNAKDYAGDTALHDAARFGHNPVVEVLLATPGVDAGARNDAGQDALAVAVEYGKDATVALLRRRAPRSRL